jgi:4'-phosphopantetheinyl transferase
VYNINLRANEIYFFYTLVEAIRDPVLLNRYRSVISRAERIKTDRYVFEKDRHNCLVTRALLRFALSTCTGAAPEAFEFLENRYGKPSLKPSLVTRPVQFNLSHSSGMTACALTLAGDIGVDIESHHRKIELDLAERYFAEIECAYLRQCPAEQKQAVFFDFWTLKESYIKAVGKGLSIDLDRFGFELDPQPRIIFDKSIEDDPDLWKFFRFAPADPYKAAIAIRSATNPGNLKLRIYKCVPFFEIQPQATLVRG